MREFTTAINEHSKFDSGMKYFVYNETTETNYQ